MESRMRWHAGHSSSPGPRVHTAPMDGELGTRGRCGNPEKTRRIPRKLKMQQPSGRNMELGGIHDGKEQRTGRWNIVTRGIATVREYMRPTE